MRHFDIFLKNGSSDFFGFWPEVSTKYDLQIEWNLFLVLTMTFNLNETYFQKNLQFGDIWLRNVKKLPKFRFLAIFSILHN